MKYTLALLAAAAGMAVAAPQASGSQTAENPIVSAPGGIAQGCKTDYNGQFEITIVKPSGIKKRQASSCGKPGMLTLSLANAQLHDNEGRTGYIAGNNSQFQFDKPVQAGYEYTAGFSLCPNGSIALGPSTVFYQCQSGGFYNLYDKNIAAQCDMVNIDIIPCDGSNYNGGASAAPVSVSSDGQPQATKAATVAPVSVFTDGQPQATVPATSAAPVAVSEFTDGQPQATANATMAAAPQPTIVPAGAANLGVSGALAAGVAVFAAALL